MWTSSQLNVMPRVGAAKEKNANTMTSGVLRTTVTYVGPGRAEHGDRADPHRDQERAQDQRQDPGREEERERVAERLEVEVEVVEDGFQARSSRRARRPGGARGAARTSADDQAAGHSSSAGGSGVSTPDGPRVFSNAAAQVPSSKDSSRTPLIHSHISGCSRL